MQTEIPGSDLEDPRLITDDRRSMTRGTVCCLPLATGIFPPMPLKTVRVPEAFEPLFQKAEEVVGQFFRQRHDDPSTGSIEISDSRYVLVRGAALSVEFFALVRSLFGPGAEQDADAFSANLLYDLAHSVGKADARNFHQKMGLEDPVAKLSAGPVHFSHSGWAFVDIHEASKPTPDDDYYLIYDHPYAFEAHAWLAAGKAAPYPICVMNAGYSSGWCEESFGVNLEAIEIACRAHGDPYCRFIMAPPQRIGDHIDRYLNGHPELDRLVARRQRPDFFSRQKSQTAQGSSDAPAETLADKLLLAYAHKLEDTQAVLQEQVQRLEVEVEERRRAEEELRLSENRLRQAHKMEALGTLAGGIAHDFNNILGAIIGYSELAHDGVPAGTEARENMAEVLSAARRARGLVKQILAFSRQSEPTLAPTDLPSVVSDAVKLLRATLPASIDIREAIDSNAGTIMADSGQINQIVLNLGSNAAHALKDDKGIIDITLARTHIDHETAAHIDGIVAGPHACLTVRDNGAGIDPATLSRVFDPFFTTKDIGEGTGLGLSAVHGIVTSHNGAVTVQSTPGQGTEFTALFPVTDDAPGPRSHPATAAVGGNERVLFIDDEEQIARIGSEILSRMGYRVTVLTEGRGALREYMDSPGEFDIIVTDNTMPNLTGLDLAREIRKFDSNTPILLTTGFTRSGLEAEAAESGIQGVLLKPYSGAELARAIRSALEGARPSAGSD